MSNNISLTIRPEKDSERIPPYLEEEEEKKHTKKGGRRVERGTHSEIGEIALSSVPSIFPPRR